MFWKPSAHLQPAFLITIRFSSLRKHDKHISRNNHGFPRSAFVNLGHADMSIPYWKTLLDSWFKITLIEDISFPHHSNHIILLFTENPPPLLNTTEIRLSSTIIDDWISHSHIKIGSANCLTDPLKSICYDYHFVSWKEMKPFCIDNYCLNSID